MAGVEVGGGEEAAEEKEVRSSCNIQDRETSQKKSRGDFKPRNTW